MNDDRWIRRILWAAFIFNLGGALIFGLPAVFEPLSGLPLPVPRTYTLLLAFFVILFGGSYGWLALQPRIVRPMVAFAAIGKSGVFVLFVLLWRLGDVPLRAVALVSGDLLFAALFLIWLQTRRASSSAAG